MAINPNLINETEPYVHSRIYNFTHFVTELKSDEDYLKNITELEDNLNQWINDLKTYEQYIYDACGVSDYVALNNKLFVNVKDKYAQVAHAILTNPHFINSLLPMINREIADKAFSVLKNSNIILDQVFNSDEVLNLSEFNKKVTEIFINVLQPKTSHYIQRSTFTDQFDQNFADSLAKYIGNQARIGITRGSTRTGLYRTFNGLIRDRGFDGAFISEDTFIQNFKHFFPQEANKLKLIFETDGHENNINKTATAAYKVVCGSGGLSAFMPNLIGQIGEQLLSFTFENENTEMHIKVHQIGTKDEVQILKEFGKLDPNLTMLEVHNTSKQSQSDELLEIQTPQGVVLIRVQSKNSLLNQLQQIADGTYNTSTQPQMLRWLNNKRDNSYLDTIAELKNVGILDKLSAENLGYILANMVWFSEVGTYINDETNGDKRTRKQGARGGIGGAQTIANETLSHDVARYIGLTTQEGIENGLKNIVLGGSNIFYFLGGRFLFPISEVLNQLLKQIKQEEHNLFSMYVQLGKIGINRSAASLYEDKRKRVGKFKTGYLYTDPGLLSVGQEQGSEILKNLKISVNANFSIARIINSAYNFASKGA